MTPSHEARIALCLAPDQPLLSTSTAPLCDSLGLCVPRTFRPWQDPTVSDFPAMTLHFQCCTRCHASSSPFGQVMDRSSGYEFPHRPMFVSPQHFRGGFSWRAAAGVLVGSYYRVTPQYLIQIHLAPVFQLAPHRFPLCRSCLSTEPLAVYPDRSWFTKLGFPSVSRALALNRVV